MEKKLLRRKLSADMAYSDMLQTYSVTDLKEICKVWGITGYSKSKKEELIEKIDQQVQAHLSDRFHVFNLDHYKIITELAKGNNVFAQFPTAANELIRLAMIVEGSIEGETQVIMPNFIYQAFGEFYNSYHETLTFNTIMKDFMELNIDLYGVMTEEAFVENFYQFNEEAIDKEFIAAAVAYTVSRTKNTILSNGYLHYYRLAEFEKVYSDIQTKEELNYRLIDHGLLQAYVQNHNSFWTEKHAELEKLLIEKFDGTKESMIDTIDELQIMASYNHGISDFIQLFSKKHEGAEVINLKAFADLVLTINNEMPHWELKGNTPAMLSQYQKQQPIVKGDKIGRNEPCPCGSGKKYKKCCLKK